MGATTIYSCNLCNDRIDGKADEEAVSIFFCNHKTLIGRFIFSYVHDRQAEGAHICGKCIQQLRELLTRKEAA